MSNHPNRRFTARRIAAMIEANVKAVDSGNITWDQFGVVNEATWRLADRGELCIIGSQASRRCAAVSKILNRGIER